MGIYCGPEGVFHIRIFLNDFSACGCGHSTFMAGHHFKLGKLASNGGLVEWGQPYEITP